MSNCLSGHKNKVVEMDQVHVLLLPDRDWTGRGLTSIPSRANATRNPWIVRVFASPVTNRQNMGMILFLLWRWSTLARTDTAIHGPSTDIQYLPMLQTFSTGKIMTGQAAESGQQWLSALPPTHRATWSGGPKTWSVRCFLAWTIHGLQNKPDAERN